MRILLSDGWSMAGHPCVADGRYLLSKDVEPGACFSTPGLDARGVELLGRMEIDLAGAPRKVLEDPR